MFLENLIGREKSAFLGLAQKIVHADGLLAPREAQLLSSLEVAAGEVVAEGTVEDLAAIFQTRQSRASALLELMGLGLVDGEYHPAESKLIKEISEALGFAEDELIGMESWIVRQVALIEEAASFWTKEDT